MQPLKHIEQLVVLLHIKANAVILNTIRDGVIIAASRDVDTWHAVLCGPFEKCYWVMVGRRTVVDGR